MRISAFVVIFTMLFCTNSYGRNDSVVVSKQVSKFYTWYFESTEPGRLDGVSSPKFSRDSMGSTRLDYSTYFSNLEMLGLSRDLQERELKSYSRCESQLRLISYDSFLTFSDLEDFERIGCDFDNRWRWIGGQDRYDTFRVLKTDISNMLARTELEFCNRVDEGNLNCPKKIWIDSKRSGAQWKIVGFSIE